LSVNWIRRGHRLTPMGGSANAHLLPAFIRGQVVTSHGRQLAHTRSGITSPAPFRPVVAPGGQHRGETAAAVSAWIAQSVACQDGGCSRPRTMERTASEVRGRPAPRHGDLSHGRLALGKNYSVTPALLRRSPAGEMGQSLADACVMSPVRALPTVLRRRGSRRPQRARQAGWNPTREGPG
jgi:hypothetical protein